MVAAALKKQGVPAESRDPAVDGRGAVGTARSRSERAVTACDGVIDVAAAMFNVSGKDLRDPRRSSLPVCRVRQIAMYVAHVVLRINMREVGNGFGRDRTTVLHACHLVEDMRDDPEFDRMVGMIERVVSAVFPDAGAR